MAGYVNCCYEYIHSVYCSEQPNDGSIRCPLLEGEGASEVLGGPETEGSVEPTRGSGGRQEREEEEE